MLFTIIAESQVMCPEGPRTSALVPALLPQFGVRTSPHTDALPTEDKNRRSLHHALAACLLYRRYSKNADPRRTATNIGRALGFHIHICINMYIYIYMELLLCLGPRITCFKYLEESSFLGADRGSASFA